MNTTIVKGACSAELIRLYEAQNRTLESLLDSKELKTDDARLMALFRLHVETIRKEASLQTGA